MRQVIVVTELRQLPPEERWQKLVLPLAQELLESGLGSIPEFDNLQREFAARGTCPAEEVAVQLTHLAYGRELVDRVLSTAGIAPGCPEMPLRWRDFHCQDYFAGDWPERGHFDELSYTPVVFPYPEVYEDVESEFLVIGTSGGDGVHFGYRRGHSGLWAYPIDGEFKFMAPSLAELVDGWCAGELST
ncbi:MAG: hypothetical protein ACK47B_25020 [Armatimonadota bacterium]